MREMWTAYFYASNRESVLAFPAPIFTNTVNSNWQYVEIAEPLNKYARMCRNSFMPVREVGPSLGQL
jgi:hypothetical protein